MHLYSYIYTNYTTIPNKIFTFTKDLFPAILHWYFDESIH